MRFFYHIIFSLKSLLFFVFFSPIIWNLFKKGLLLKNVKFLIVICCWADFKCYHNDLSLQSYFMFTFLKFIRTFPLLTILLKISFAEFRSHNQNITISMSFISNPNYVGGHVFTALGNTKYFLSHVSKEDTRKKLASSDF